MKPRRIQRKRMRGWKMPPNTVYVGRLSKWGNPFIPGDLTVGECIYAFHLNLLRGNLKVTLDDVQKELRGKNLACWCALDAPCHADILLQLANE